MFSKISLMPILIFIIILLIIFVYLFIYYLPMKTLRIATQHFNEWLEIHGRIKARQMTMDWLKKQLIVKDTGVSEDGTIWIEFRNGIEANISTSSPDTL